METVFLLMWAADVAAGLTSLGVFIQIPYAFLLGTAYIEDNERLKKFLLGKWWVFAALGGFAVLAPSKNVLYLAAAGKTAQIGAAAVEASPIGRKTIDALGAVLDRVIREADEKK